MDITVTHTHTYKRWKTIWTLLLEKDPGNPKINRLQTIHLYEADYNLLKKHDASPTTKAVEEPAKAQSTSP